MSDERSFELDRAIFSSIPPCSIPEAEENKGSRGTRPLWRPAGFAANMGMNFLHLRTWFYLRGCLAGGVQTLSVSHSELVLVNILFSVT